MPHGISVCLSCGESVKGRMSLKNKLAYSLYSYHAVWDDVSQPILMSLQKSLPGDDEWRLAFNSYQCHHRAHADCQDHVSSDSLLTRAITQARRQPSDELRLITPGGHDCVPLPVLRALEDARARLVLVVSFDGDTGIANDTGLGETQLH